MQRTVVRRTLVCRTAVRRRFVHCEVASGKSAAFVSAKSCGDDGFKIGLGIVKQRNDEVRATAPALRRKFGEPADALEDTRHSAQSLAGLHPPDKLRPLHGRHVVVGEQEIHFAGAEDPPRFFAVGCGKHLETERQTRETLQPHAQYGSHGRVVIYDKNGLLCRFHVFAHDVRLPFRESVMCSISQRYIVLEVWQDRERRWTKIFVPASRFTILLASDVIRHTLQSGGARWRF